MKTGWRSIFAVIIAGLLLLISGIPSDAARRVARGSQAYGAVGAGGAIRVTLIRGSQSASGSGRLSSNSGGGRWRTSGGECFGSWSAARQAAY
jgi:hypothetical protein